MKKVALIKAVTVFLSSSAWAITPSDFRREIKCFQGLGLLSLTTSAREGVEAFYDETTGLLAMPKIAANSGLYVIAPNGAAEVKLPRPMPATPGMGNASSYLLRVGLPGKSKNALGYTVDPRFNDSSNDVIMWQDGPLSDADKPYVTDMPLLETSIENVRKAVLWRFNGYVSRVYQHYQRERRTAFIRDAEAYRQIFGSNPNPAWAADPAGAYMKSLEICGAISGLEQSVREELAKFNGRSNSPVSMKQGKTPIKRSLANTPSTEAFLPPSNAKIGH